MSTIGESVALGVAGVILWGDASYASSKVSDVTRNTVPVTSYHVFKGIRQDVCEFALA